MIYFVPILYFVLVLSHAIWHWYRIVKKNELITSIEKFLEYSIACFVCFMALLKWVKPIHLIIFPIVTRAAFYDALLNVFRKKPLLYEGEIKKKKSWIDWIENQIGLPTWSYRLVYALAYVGYLIYYLLKGNVSG